VLFTDEMRSRVRDGGLGRRELTTRRALTASRALTNPPRWTANCA
jgi:hypothetical protein